MMETQSRAEGNADDEAGQSVQHHNRVLTFSGYAFVLVSVFCFGTIAYLKLQQSIGKTSAFRVQTWLDLMQQEAATISLLLIAVVAAMLGKSLLTSVHMGDARTIPYEDLPLVRQAVIDGKSEPIDQYVRLRALSGISGNFTKLGVTGLPLTTVVLTLIFSFIAIFTLDRNTANAFLDLAKLTLGAFIGSFVQGRVEQRRMIDSGAPSEGRRSDLIA
jgi:hypothetical protein